MGALAIEPVQIDAPGATDLLGLATGASDPARTARSLAPYRNGEALLAAASADGRLVGVIGYRLPATPDGRGATTLLHLATDPGFRHRGVGSALVRWVRAQCAAQPLEAETDRDAVGFYRAAGFRIDPLGEVYPGVERFRCTLGRGLPEGTEGLSPGRRGG